METLSIKGDGYINDRGCIVFYIDEHGVFMPECLISMIYKESLDKALIQSFNNDFLQDV